MFDILVSAPVIISPPRDSYGPLGANLTLDCEARGYPAPTITWQFNSNEGKTYNLPSNSTGYSCERVFLVKTRIFDMNK